MTIGIDGRTITAPGGIGEYTRQSVKQLVKINRDDRLVLFLTDEIQAKGFQSEKVNVKILPFYRYKKFLPIVYSHLIVPLLMSRQKLDVCLFPANIIPLFFKGKSAVVVHDLAVYKFPELFPNQAINFDRRVVVPQSLRRADRIIAVSQSTKKDLLELFRIKSDKIAVVYEGGDFNFEVGNLNEALPVGLESKKYFLFVGTIEPRKNLLKLIESYKKFVQSGYNDYDLVLAGKSGWKNDQIFEAIKQANQEFGQEKIKYLGFITNEQKAALYQNAWALAMPSLYEGFGLPAAEALRFRLPMILSDNSSLPEIGGEVAVYVDANLSETIFEALQKVADLAYREELAGQAQARASRFTWEACAQGVLEVLKSIK
jgi:glycosyltransferase involved in cell wall biosynthesis